MTINSIMYLMVTLARVLQQNPGRLVPYVAAASVVTLIIAVMTDAWLKTRPEREKKTAVARIDSSRR
jgi:hypothetical protein